MYTNADGLSALEECHAQLVPGFAVPPAEPLHSAPFLALDSYSCFWVGAPPDWAGDARHPSPRRQIFVVLQGAYEVTVGTGETRRFTTGSLLLLEDTTGAGHSTRIIGDEPCLIFAVGLPDRD